MRFVVTGEWTKNRLLGLIVWFFLLFASALWVTNGMLYFDSMGLSTQSVVSHYLGDEAAFRPPRTFRGMLEITHFHLFAMGILLLTLTHLLLFVPIAGRTKGILVTVSFVAAFLDEAAGWLVRYASPHFAILKIVSFLALQAAMAITMGLIAWALAGGARSAYSDPA